MAKDCLQIDLIFSKHDSMSIPVCFMDRLISPYCLPLPLLVTLLACAPEHGPSSEARVENKTDNLHADKGSRSETLTSDSMGLEKDFEPILKPTASQIQKGQDAFYSYGCWHCHQLGDEEAPGLPDWENTGPDLADVGSRLSVAAIAQSILEPNAVIAEPRHMHEVDGQSRMPSFANPQAQEDIACMVAFLAQCRLEPPQEPLIIKATDNTLESLMKAEEGLVLLGFWAEWCFACLEASPALESVAPSFGGQLKVFKIGVDENPLLVNRFAPDLNFPCFVLMHQGKLLDRRYGMDPTQEPEIFFRKWINQHLSKLADNPQPGA